MFLIKKWGILIKKESESLIFTGLKIPRDYVVEKRDKKIWKWLVFRHLLQEKSLKIDETDYIIVLSMKNAFFKRFTTNANMMVQFDGVLDDLLENTQ